MIAHGSQLRNVLQERALQTSNGARAAPERLAEAPQVQGAADRTAPCLATDLRSSTEACSSYGWNGTRRGRAGTAGANATTSPFGSVEGGAFGNQTVTFCPVRGSRMVRIIGGPLLRGTARRDRASVRHRPATSHSRQ